MKDTKLKRITDGLNAWLKAHNFKLDITIEKKSDRTGEYYSIMLTFKGVYVAKSQIANIQHWESHYEEELKKFIFDYIQKDFDKEALCHNSPL